MEESTTVKRSHALGWNHPIHLAELVTIYKPRIFEDMAALSKTLSVSHFELFYTNLAPIDDGLAETITLY
jgi:hypothetical protein